MNAHIHDHTGVEILHAGSCWVPNQFTQPDRGIPVCGFFCQGSGPGGLALPLPPRCARRQCGAKLPLFSSLLALRSLNPMIIGTWTNKIASRADSRSANNPLKWSALHLQGLLRSPSGSCLRLAPH